MSFELMGYHLTSSQKGLDTIRANYRYLAGIIPTWLEVKENGYLETKPNKAEIGMLERLMGRKAIRPLIQNYDLSSEVANKLINDTKAMTRAINRMAIYLAENGLKGLNLDLEGIKYTNKDKFNKFILMLAETFHKKDLELDLSIPAKTENNKDKTWSGAYQYDFLGQFADRIMLMAYDYHWVGGTPGPIAPLSWVRDVIDYAIIEIPLEKIYLGIVFYGYDWELNGENKARGLVYSQIKELQNKYKTEVEWDQEAQSPYLKYTIDGKKHEVWFENSQSIRKKLELVKEFQLSGVAFWRLGQEDPEVWQVVNEVKQK